MKKGCLIKSLVISTIFFAAVFYIFTNKFDDVVLKPLKGQAYNWSFKEIEQKVSALQDEDTKVELTAALEKYKEYLNTRKDISMNNLEVVADSLDQIIGNAEITPDDVEKFKNYIDEVITDEK